MVRPYSTDILLCRKTVNTSSHSLTHLDILLHLAPLYKVRLDLLYAALCVVQHPLLNKIPVFGPHFVPLLRIDPHFLSLFYFPHVIIMWLLCDVYCCVMLLRHGRDVHLTWVKSFTETLSNKDLGFWVQGQSPKGDFDSYWWEVANHFRQSEALERITLRQEGQGIWEWGKGLWLLVCTVRYKSQVWGYRAQRLPVLIVKENNRVTGTIDITGTIESPWTMGHRTIDVMEQ